MYNKSTFGQTILFFLLFSYIFIDYNVISVIININYIACNAVPLHGSIISQEADAKTIMK